MKKILLALFLLGPLMLFAQDPADIFHKTINIDSIETITLDIAESDEFVVKSWPGNYLLIETSILMYNGNQNLMKVLKEEGRWGIDANISGESLQLVSKQMLRPIMKTDRGDTKDVVNIVIYLPEDFKGNGSSYSR